MKDALNGKALSVISPLLMADQPEAQPADDSPDPDRGLFDLPDFRTIGGTAVDWCRRNPLGAFLIAAVFVVIGYFYFGVKAFLGLSQTSVEWMVASWNPENDQEHCWAIIPVAVLLVLLRWRDLKSAPKNPSNSGLWFVAAGILAFVAGVRCVEGRLTIIALPLLGYGIARYLFGVAVARIVVFPCVFLLFMVPVGEVVQSTADLQPKTAKVIYHLSNLVGIPIQVDGTTIYSPDKRFEPLEVAGGCSGIRSLMAMTTLAALYAYFVMRTPMRGMILFGCSLAFAVLGNFARVFSVVLFARFIDPKTATGLYHDYSGFVFFPVAVLAMVGVGNLLNRDWWELGRKWMAPASIPEAPPLTGSSSADATTATKRAGKDTPKTYDY